MIRINLLAVERGVTKRSALIPAAHRVTIGASLLRPSRRPSNPVAQRPRNVRPSGSPSAAIICS